MAVTLRYFTDFGKPAFQHNRVDQWRNLCTSLLYFVVRVRCRRKESSRSLSQLLMSFLFTLIRDHNDTINHGWAKNKMTKMRFPPMKMAVKAIAQSLSKTAAASIQSFFISSFLTASWLCSFSLCSPVFASGIGERVDVMNRHAANFLHMIFFFCNVKHRSYFI